MGPVFPDGEVLEERTLKTRKSLCQDQERSKSGHQFSTLSESEEHQALDDKGDWEAKWGHTMKKSGLYPGPAEEGVYGMRCRPGLQRDHFISSSELGPQS